VTLIGLYAIIPIVIAARGPCDLSNLIIFFLLVSPPFLLLYIARRLKLIEEKTGKASLKVYLMIYYFLLEVIYPFLIGGLISSFYKTSPRDIEAYVYFLVEVFTLWIFQLIDWIGGLMEKILLRIILKIKKRKSKISMEAHGKSEPLVIRFIILVDLLLIIVAIILGAVLYLFLWSALCQF